MSERKYSVREIDALRSAVETKYLFGSYSPQRNFNMSCTYQESDKIIAVEEGVRTWMLAGITAEELYASEAPNTEGRE